MPQMMPINWMLSFIIFIIIFILFNMMNYYIFFNKTPKINNFPKKLNNYMNWKW
uniref:ATP synthase F0 subunit 8 n=1 Tax=Pseudocoladenia festa TaxID=2585919 RepID=UPI002551E566|nr:ATP synthase F0 subunit 8 [Pseudocoladenia festa]WGM81146.1 ATP synthase F0 subunit 8 [Pseudocoladenia festa]